MDFTLIIHQYIQSEQEVHSNAFEICITFMENNFSYTESSSNP